MLTAVPPVGRVSTRKRWASLATSGSPTPRPGLSLRGIMPRSDSPGLGVGLPLVAKLAQRFRVETRPTGGTAVSMVFPVRDPA